MFYSYDIPALVLSLTGTFLVIFSIKFVKKYSRQFKLEQTKPRPERSSYPAIFLGRSIAMFFISIIFTLLLLLIGIGFIPDKV